MNLHAVKTLVALDEGPKLEFKRSTGELREALHTVCAFLNADGGKVLFGVRPDGTLVGQDVSDKTLRDVARALEGFEPPARLETERVRLQSGREMLIFHVEGLSDAIPFTFEGRAYERVQSTTRRMPQRRYEQLLLARAHSKRRWENQETEETRLPDIDREQVFHVPVGLTPQVTPQVTALLEAVRQPRSREALQRVVGLKDRIHFQRAHLEPLIAAGLLERTIPDKPRSRLQRYRTTTAGVTVLQRERSADDSTNV